MRPHLKLIVAWDPSCERCRETSLVYSGSSPTKLKMHPDAPAQRTAKVISHGSYPLLERLYDLTEASHQNLTVEGDSWLIEIAYEQTAEYHPAMTFPPQQRVAFARRITSITEARKSVPRVDFRLSRQRQQ